MNIIEARETAMAGKTVICPSGFKYNNTSFSDVKEWDNASIFGEWQLQSDNDTVVFETIVELANEFMFGSRRGLISDRSLYRLRDKTVRVTVEVIE